MPSPWTEGHVQTNGITTFYRRSGGAGPPVVLLHGLTDNGACWTRLARSLEADYDLVMPDARGHGRSTVPASGYSPEERAADVIGLIDALGLDRPVLVGHSMGGLTAALVAAEAPARIRGAVLEDPSFVSAEAWAAPRRREWAAQHEATLALSEEQLIARGRAENPRWPDEILPPWARAKLETSLKVFDWLELPPSDYAAIVGRLGVPTLLVTGEPALGALVSDELATELSARNPLLRVAHIPGAGHCIRYEQADSFADIVKTFLAERFV